MGGLKIKLPCKSHAQQLLSPSSFLDQLRSFQPPTDRLSGRPCWGFSVELEKGMIHLFEGFKKLLEGIQEAGGGEGGGENTIKVAKEEIREGKLWE
ncbi:MAG: hypothetical protein FD145_1414 [Candidatus Saganbacteria bacterium]|uniref:Uncharacterized protein n=1 Tax=Candidatus Saganbacteria bacterium TaxID=2575572 RepID=A0A833KZW0_UNCSA|nr:MAG: hypothetical protein FD145_1414 [Candidatus Saganbacteria bacterium]